MRHSGGKGEQRPEVGAAQAGDVETGTLQGREKSTGDPPSAGFVAEWLAERSNFRIEAYFAIMPDWILYARSAYGRGGGGRGSRRRVTSSGSFVLLEAVTVW